MGGSKSVRHGDSSAWADDRSCIQSPVTSSYIAVVYIFLLYLQVYSHFYIFAYILDIFVSYNHNIWYTLHTITCDSCVYFSTLFESIFAYIWRYIRIKFITFIRDNRSCLQLSMRSSYVKIYFCGYVLYIYLYFLYIRMYIYMYIFVKYMYIYI